LCRPSLCFNSKCSGIFPFTHFIPSAYEALLELYVKTCRIIAEPCRHFLGKRRQCSCRVLLLKTPTSPMLSYAKQNRKASFPLLFYFTPATAKKKTSHILRSRLVIFGLFGIGLFFIFCLIVCVLYTYLIFSTLFLKFSTNIAD